MQYLYFEFYLGLFFLNFFPPVSAFISIKTAKNKQTY